MTGTAVACKLEVACAASTMLSCDTYRYQHNSIAQVEGVLTNSSAQGRVKFSR